MAEINLIAKAKVSTSLRGSLYGITASSCRPAAVVLGYKCGLGDSASAYIRNCEQNKELCCLAKYIGDMRKRKMQSINTTLYISLALESLIRCE